MSNAQDRWDAAERDYKAERDDGPNPELLALARAVAAQRIVVNSFCVINMPADVEKRIELDARLMLARDRLAILEARYAVGVRKYAASLDTNHE